MPTPKKKNQGGGKKVKAWAVIWTDGSLESYGISNPKPLDIFVGCEIESFVADRMGVKRKNTTLLYADIALFKSKKGAKGYTKGNKKWKIVPITLTLPQGENRV